MLKILILLLIPFFAFASSIIGLVKKDKNIYQFTEFISADKDNEFSINYKSSVNEIINITYIDSNNKAHTFPDVNLNSGELFTFPEFGKFVKFDSAGIHRVKIKSSSNKVYSIDIHLTDENKFSEFFKEINYKNSKLTPIGKLNFKKHVKINNVTSLDHLRPISSKDSTRASSSVIFKKVSKSVVLIWGKKAVGTGVAIGKNKILTNVHVIKDNPEMMLATAPSSMSTEKVENAEFYTFKILKIDAQKDLALLEVNNKSF